MTTQFQSTANLLSTIIILCFSFFIPVIAYWAYDAEILSKLLGYSFVCAFSLNMAALFVKSSELSAAFSQTSEPMLLLLILMLLIARPQKKAYVKFKFLLILLPAILFFVEIFSLPARSFLVKQHISISASLVIATAILYVLRKDKSNMNRLFWPILPLLASELAQYYLTSRIPAYAAPIFKFIAYSLFLEVFYQIFLISKLDKVQNAEKKLAEINRSIEYEIKRRMLDIEKVNTKLADIAKTDSMSKTMNKSAVMNVIESMINKKNTTEFSILMFDIDNFKAINDTFGHVTGDNCIIMLASLARNSIRDFDLVGRYGGDEFIIVLPNTGLNQALLIAERFRQRVELSQSPHYTVSIGVATYPADGNTTKALIEAADEGMYISKRRSRNTVSHRSLS